MLFVAGGAFLVGDSLTLFGGDSIADDITDSEALLVLGYLQPGLTQLVRNILAHQVRDSEALLLGDRGALLLFDGGADLLHSRVTLGLLDDIHLGLTLELLVSDRVSLKVSKKSLSLKRVSLMSLSL